MEDCFLNKNSDKQVYLILERGRARKKLVRISSQFMVANLRFLHAKEKFKRELATLEKNIWGDIKKENMRNELKQVYSEIFKYKKLFKFEMLNFKLVMYRYQHRSSYHYYHLNGISLLSY